MRSSSGLPPSRQEASAILLDHLKQAFRNVADDLFTHGGHHLPPDAIDFSFESLLFLQLFALLDLPFDVRPWPFRRPNVIGLRALDLGVESLLEECFHFLQSFSTSVDCGAIVLNDIFSCQ